MDQAGNFGDSCVALDCTRRAAWSGLASSFAPTSKRHRYIDVCVLPRWGMEMAPLPLGVPLVGTTTLNPHMRRHGVEWRCAPGTCDQGGRSASSGPGSLAGAGSTLSSVPKRAVVGIGPCRGGGGVEFQWVGKTGAGPSDARAAPWKWFGGSRHSSRAKAAAPLASVTWSWSAQRPSRHPRGAQPALGEPESIAGAQKSPGQAARGKE